MKRALISVSDKRGIVEFAQELTRLGFEIVASEGTAKNLKEAGITVRTVSEITGFPEILGGRVKTLHPKIHGGILCGKEYRRGVQLNAPTEKEEILPFDMVVCNFYPFPESPITNHQSQNLVERIDIGGPAMVRAAAKNYENVAVVTSPDQYGFILEELKKNGGTLSMELRLSLAQKAFEFTRNYDESIAREFKIRSSGMKPPRFPRTLDLRYEKVSDLRYGENPHQEGAFYRDPKPGADRGGAIFSKQFQGKDLSYNNLLDFDSAFSILMEFNSPTAVIIKHTNPCGVGRGENITDSYRLAHLADPISAFGGVVGFNRTCDEETAREIVSTFMEGVIAPGYTEEGLKIFREKKNLRILECEFPQSSVSNSGYKFHWIRGGLLLEDPDEGEEDPAQWEVATRREPTEKERNALLFAWKVVKHVKSNGIVLASQNRTLGIGTGQMSRVDAVELALRKARGTGSYIIGSVMASDGFFPFRDSIDLVSAEGITAVVQPGGSIRDKEVIQACLEHDMAMFFTKKRHFKH